MCHCTPGKRTPCCGPQCCGTIGGCAFCTGKRESRPPGPIALDFGGVTIDPGHLQTLLSIGTRARSVRVPTVGMSAPVETISIAGGALAVTLDEGDRLAEAIKRAVATARKQGLR